VTKKQNGRRREILWGCTGSADIPEVKLLVEEMGGCRGVMYVLGEGPQSDGDK